MEQRLYVIRLRSSKLQKRVFLQGPSSAASLLFEQLRVLDDSASVSQQQKQLLEALPQFEQIAH